MTSTQAALLQQFGRDSFLPALLKRPPARPRFAVLALAAALFCAIFGLRLANTNADDPVMIFNAVPIALLALEAGRRGGIAGATVAVASLGLWSLIEHEQLSLIGYLARVSTFFLVGALAGYLAEYLRQARDAQQLLFDLAPESALAIDLDGNVTIANAAAQSLFGYGAHELAGQPVDQFVPDFFAVLRRSFREVRNPGDALRFTACFKDGRATRVRGTVEALASDRCALLIRLQTTEASPEGA